MGVLFLPAAGYRNGASLNNAGSNGNYWSASSSSIGSYYAQYERFVSGHIYPQRPINRCHGLSVRLVKNAN